MRKAETKHYQVYQENVQLYHNVGKSAAFTGASEPYAVYLNMLGVPVGATEQSRVGAKVQSRGVRVQLWLSNKLDRPNVMYRIMVLTYPTLDPNTNLIWTGLNQLVTDNIGGNPNNMLGPVDTKIYGVKYDKRIQPFAGEYLDKEHSRYHSFFLKTNRTITYQDLADGSSNNIPKSQNNRYALFVIPYDAYGSVVTDNIATVAFQIRHFFKDV